MKKLYFLLCYTLGMVSLSFAQDTTTFYGKSQYIFKNLDKSQISSGLLAEYGMEFLELANYDGAVMTDSNYVGLQEWRLLYGSLYSSQVHTAAPMLGLDSINKRVLNYISLNQPLSFAVMHYRYQNLRPDAVSANLLSVSNDQLYDVTGRSQSPYQSKEVFAVAPIRQVVMQGSHAVIFRPQLFFSNSGKTLSNVAMAIGSGSYQNIAFNTPTMLFFSQEGFVDVKIRINYSDGSQYDAHSKVMVVPSPVAQAYDKQGQSTTGNKKGNATVLRYGDDRVANNEMVTATTAWQGLTATGDITIQLSRFNNTGQIRKPLIVVEGFDMENTYGFVNFTRSTIEDATGQFITLNDELDDTHQYDLIFLNFGNATDYIQRNALLLRRVIELVNSRKTTFNGQRQQNVIIGLSMGGLVARYALRQMELNNVAHETRLFISHDTPHHGANVPVGAQVAVQHLSAFKLFSPTLGSGGVELRWKDMFPELVETSNTFYSPAARQMLIQRYVLGPNYQLIADNDLHNSFYTELNNMGWPVNSKNLTLSNGACNGTRVFPDNSRIFEMIGRRPMTYGGNLWRSALMSVAAPVAPVAVYGGNVNPASLLIQFPLSLFSTRTGIHLDFRINAVPSSGVGEVYRGDMYIKRKIAWIINSTSYIMKTRISSVSGTKPLDNAPGGLYDMEEFGVDPTAIQDGLPKFFEGIRSAILQPRFCFVPTVSSLAISNPWQNLNNNLCTTANCLSSSGVKGYFAPQQNQIHISYTQPSADWLLLWQNSNYDCAKICESGLKISGNSKLCTPATYSIPNFPTGATVNWSVTGNLKILGSSTGMTVDIAKAWEGGTGSGVLTATINNNCGSFAITKSIVVTPENMNLTIAGDGFYDPVPLNTEATVYIIGYNQPYSELPAGTTYEWVVEPASTSRIISGANARTMTFKVYEEGIYDVGVLITTPCGTYGIYDFIVTPNGEEYYYYEEDNYSYSSYPNPSSEELIVERQEKSTTQEGMSQYDQSRRNSNSNPKKMNIPFEVALYNEKGEVVVKGKGSPKVRLNTSGLANGIYYLHYKEKGKIVKKQIIVRH